MRQMKRSGTAKRQRTVRETGSENAGKGENMAEKNAVKVLIEGKAVTLGGYESREYLEQVAYYINHKIAELRDTPGYMRQSADMKSILLALNIADDYCKAKERADTLERDMESKDGEGYEVKQDLVSARVRIQQLERELAAYKQMHAPVQMGVDVRTGEIAPDYRTLEQNPNAVYGTGQKNSANVTVQDAAGNARMETETGTDSQPDEVEHARNDKYAKRSKRYVKNHGN